MQVSAIIPAYNEEAALQDVVEEYSKYTDEVVIVDDGSKDATSEIGAELEESSADVVFVSHSDNRGKAYALRTGVNAASGDIVVFTDADMTYPAEYVPELVDAVEDGADMALGNRFGEDGGANIPFLNRLGNKTFSFLVSFVGGVEIADAQTGMRAMRKERFAELDANATSLEFETKMTVRAAQLGYRIEEVPIHYRERVGETKLQPLRDGWRMFRSIGEILYGEASPMLRTGLVLGTVLLLIGLYTGSVTLYDYLTTGIVQHDFYPLLTALFVILAFQVVTALLIGEQVKNRLRRVEEAVTYATDH